MLSSRNRQSPKYVPLACWQAARHRVDWQSIGVASRPSGALPRAGPSQIPQTSTLVWPILTSLRNGLSFQAACVGSKRTKCPASAPQRFM